MTRPALILLASALGLWVLAVPMLHGHLPGAAAHLHGSDRAAADAGDVGSVEVGAVPVHDEVMTDPSSPLADEEVPLPLATALALGVVVVPLVARLVVAPTRTPRPSPRSALPLRPGTPVARHEVIVV